MNPAAALGVTLAANAVALFVAVTLLWRVAVRRRDVSVIDLFWGAGFALVAVLTLLLPGGEVGRQALLAALTCGWGLRLAVHLSVRAAGRGEDPRYTAMRARVRGDFDRWALVRVFWLQGLLIWLISAPVQVGGTLAAADDPWWPAAAGAALWLLGFTFEAVGDAQLAAFKRDPAHAGRVFDGGLWRYTRHPNYFGDACVWWGLYLVSCTHPAALATVPAPALMTFLLVRVSGKALLEDRLRRTKPGYAAYVARTSGFLPRRPAASPPADEPHR
jgi:steroid 5-alpha reductase family enzyme